MRVRPFPWLSATSSGVPRLDGLLSTRVVTRLAGGLVGIKLDVVPAGAPISSWNCSSDGKFEDEDIQNELGLRLSWALYLFSGVTSISALQGLNLIMQLQHFTLTTMINALVGLFVHYLSQHA